MHKPRSIDGILRKLKGKAVTGEDLFRGEPEHFEEEPFFGTVSSNFFRRFLNDKNFDTDTNYFDMEELQTAVLSVSKQFSRKPISELERLSIIQHYGGQTNLIDFTKDYLIALFMAYDGSPDDDGRIICQARKQMERFIEEPYEPINRVIAQKSVFVRHPDGFMQPDNNNIINIKSDLKQKLLINLRNSHDISVETIYNDIHGFIKDQKNHKQFYKTIYDGLVKKKLGDSGNGK